MCPPEGPADVRGQRREDQLRDPQRRGLQAGLSGRRLIGRQCFIG